MQISLLECKVKIPYIIRYFIIKTIRGLSNYNANLMLADSSDNGSNMGTSLYNFISFKYCSLVSDL